MRPRKRAALVAVMACLGAMAPRGALGAERRCAAISVEADASFHARWPELPARVREDFAMRGDIDACARVELHVEDGSAIGILVTLPDGRTASRSVTRPDDVIPTLQALLLVPDRAPAIHTTPPAAGTTLSEPIRVASDRGDHAAPSRPPGSPRALGIELSVITSAHVGDGQFGYGMGALSFVEMSRWLVGFEGRIDGYQSVRVGDTQTTFELALLAGRRFDFNGVSLDLISGPALAMPGVTTRRSDVIAVRETSSTTPPPAAATRATEPQPQATPGSVPRWRLGARLGFMPHSVFRAFVGVDGELGLSRPDESAQSLNAPVPPLPNYSIGIGVGATVGTP